MKTSIILGIDPGTASCGYGIIKMTSNNIEIMEHGCIRTKADQERGERLKYIYNKVSNLLKEYAPDCIAMERVFFYKGSGRNFSTALNVGEAVGVIRLCASINNVPVMEYTPTQVKEVLVGYGKADKKQVEFMVKEILKLEDSPASSHASDALACALTHRFHVEFSEE